MSCKGEVPSRGGVVKVYCFPEIGAFSSPANGSAVKETPLFRPAFPVGAPKAPKDRPPSQGKVDLVGVPAGFGKDIETKAYCRGYREGEKAGMEVARKEVTTKIRDLDEALRELETIKKHFSVALEREALGLAIAVAKKIVGYEVQKAGDTIIKVVRDALVKVVDDTHIRVRVHPSQIETIENARSQFADLVTKTEAIVFEPDQGLTPGGCLIETDFGDIDARLETQFRVVEEALTTEFQIAHKTDEGGP